MNKRKRFFSRHSHSTLSDSNSILFATFWTLVFLLGLYLRTSGLFRGLGAQGSIFHPDEAKQVLALFNYLNWDYVRYYGSLFYDGYPYGLNHLDEFLLRPLVFFLGYDPPDHFPLYYYSRLLRVVYGMITLLVAYKIVHRLLQDKIIALVAMLLLSIAPLSVTVTHFATGDIGVDLFTALCFLFLVFYVESDRKMTWLAASGFAVGAAFSAKYNGLLVGMVPGMVLILEYLNKNDFRLFAFRCFVLMAGVLIGVLLFTPNLLLDSKPTLGNMVANFKFIKNYNVPAEILTKPWFEKALLGLKNNTPYIISSLGYIAFFTSIPALLRAVKQYSASSCSYDKPEHSRYILILSITLFPILTLFIALTGKYTVQPFHFSSLQMPIIVSICFLFSFLRASPNPILKACNILLIGLIIFEFGRISWRENFFWRHEDNLFFEQNLPATFYDAESFYQYRSGKIRSIFLEPPGNSVFRNCKREAKGPDSYFWNALEVAPLPQVPNPVGKNWIFLNGPTYPRNERMLEIRGKGYGKTIQRYLVLPAGANWPTFGVRSGSFPTEITIDFGSATTTIKLEAHQQKTIRLEPTRWKVSGGQTSSDEKVYIIPLRASVPHNDVWLTVLTTEKEAGLFALFGGGQSETVSAPEAISPQLQEEYFDAITRLRYLELSLYWRVQDGKRIPMWEVPIPAGRYTLTAEVDGLVDESEITIEFEDASGEKYSLPKQSFRINKGIQRIEYDFTKPFVPYQGRFVISSVTGKCQILKFKLFPDYENIAADFSKWRRTGIKPAWVTRFRE